MIQIRPACERDLAVTAGLLSQLGYPVSPAELAPHFEAVLKSREVDVFLAEAAGPIVVGLISLALLATLRLRGFQVCIEEMIVDAGWRGRDIGGQLVRFAEGYARQRGAVMLEVLSNRGRESFHRGFYEKHGFALSEHAVFRMEIAQGRKTID